MPDTPRLFVTTIFCHHDFSSPDFSSPRLFVTTTFHHQRIFIQRLFVTTTFRHQRIFIPLLFYNDLSSQHQAVSKINDGGCHIREYTCHIRSGSQSCTNTCKIYSKTAKSQTSRLDTPLEVYNFITGFPCSNQCV